MLRAAAVGGAGVGLLLSRIVVDDGSVDTDWSGAFRASAPGQSCKPSDTAINQAHPPLPLARGVCLGSRQSRHALPPSFAR